MTAAPKSSFRAAAGVECFDINRDARTFACDKSAVAMPPCRSWSAYCAHQAKPLPGQKELGPLCVDFLRRCGGVLEHPAHSRLFDYCGLPKPGSTTLREIWSMEVSQAWWGDTRTKTTWLSFFNILPVDVQIPFRLHVSHGDRRRWQVMSTTQRSATCPAFAEWLVGVARKVPVNNPAQQRTQTLSDQPQPSPSAGAAG